jgi:hypothetical protein
LGGQTRNLNVMELNSTRTCTVSKCLWARQLTLLASPQGISIGRPTSLNWEANLQRTSIPCRGVTLLVT